MHLAQLLKCKLRPLRKQPVFHNIDADIMRFGGTGLKLASKDVVVNTAGNTASYPDFPETIREASAMSETYINVLNKE